MPMRRSRTPHLSRFLAALAAAALAAAPLVGAQTTADSVRAAYEPYRDALLAGDGSAAVQAVDLSAVDLYGRYVALALDADSVQVRGLGATDRMTVLSLRHRVPADTVRSFDGASALAYSVRRRWFDGVGMRLVTLGAVRVEADRAWAVLKVLEDSDGSEVPFRRRGGVWRLDLVALTRTFEPDLLAMIAEAGQSEDEFVVFALEVLSGRPVLADVWQPLGRR